MYLKMISAHLAWHTYYYYTCYVKFSQKKYPIHICITIELEPNLDDKLFISQCSSYWLVITFQDWKLSCFQWHSWRLDDCRARYFQTQWEFLHSVGTLGYVGGCSCLNKTVENQIAFVWPCRWDNILLTIASVQALLLLSYFCGIMVCENTMFLFWIVLVWSYTFPISAANLPW